MADQALRLSCIAAAQQLFACHGGGPTRASDTSVSGPTASARQRLQVAATQVSDAAMSLHRLCCSQAQGGPITIIANTTGKGASPMEEAAYCVCAVVRAAHPTFWLALTRRAVVLRPRHPVLRLGEPTPLPIPLREIERFAGRSQRVVEKLVRPAVVRTPTPSSPPPQPPASSATSANTVWEVFSPIQAEQLAVCYYWSITTAAERVKYTKQGVLFEASVPSAFSPPGSLDNKRDDPNQHGRHADRKTHGGVAMEHQGAFHEEDTEGDGTTHDGSVAGTYRRDRFWQAPHTAAAQGHVAIGASSRAQDPRHARKVAGAAARLTAPVLPSFDAAEEEEEDADEVAEAGQSGPGAGEVRSTVAEPSRRPTVATRDAAPLRTALKRLREPSPPASSCGTASVPTAAVNAHLSKVLTAQARLYSDDIDVRLPEDHGHVMLPVPTPRHTDNESHGDASGGVHSQADAPRSLAAVDERARTYDVTAAGQDDESHMWHRLLAAFDAPDETTLSQTDSTEAEGRDGRGAGSPQSVCANVAPPNPDVHARAMGSHASTSLAAHAAQRLADVLVSPSSDAGSSSSAYTTSTEELCAKVELVKSHLYWHQLECCVGNPLWLSQRQYARHTGGAAATASSAGTPARSTTGTVSTSSYASPLHARLGSSYDHLTPLPRTPPAAAWTGDALTAFSQAHFLAPSRVRVGVGQDGIGPLLSSRPVGLVTAPLLWARLVLCAAWLRSYATVYLPVMAAQRAAAAVECAARAASARHQEPPQNADIACAEAKQTSSSPSPHSQTCAETNAERAAESKDGMPRVCFDAAPESVAAQQAIAAFCIDVIQDAYTRFNGGRAPPLPAPSFSWLSVLSSPPLPPPLTDERGASTESDAGRATRSAGVTRRRGHTEPQGSVRAPALASRHTLNPSTIAVSAKLALCPVCDGLTRQAPPILCGALREDRTVLQRRLRAHYLPPRRSDPHCLTPVLEMGEDLSDGVAASWAAWYRMASRSTRCVSDKYDKVDSSGMSRATVDAATDAAQRMLAEPTVPPLPGVLHDLHIRALARRLHALVETLVGLQHLGKLDVTAASAAPDSRRDRHQREEGGDGDAGTSAQIPLPQPAETCCPDLLPLSMLDPVFRISQPRRPMAASGGVRHAHLSASSRRDGGTASSSSSSATALLALYDAYGWAAGPLFEPLLALEPSSIFTIPTSSARHVGTAESGAVPMPSLAALTDMLVSVVPRTCAATLNSTTKTGSVSPTKEGDETAVPPLSSWERCALVWHGGALCTRRASCTSSSSSASPRPPVFDDVDGVVRRELQATQVHLLAWLDFFPAIPLLAEEDGVMECGRCFNLFHQACVCPSQRDMRKCEFLCHACRMLEPA